MLEKLAAAHSAEARAVEYNRMENPWLRIPASDYEAHMALPEVSQTQALSKLMASVPRSEWTISRHFYTMYWPGCSGQGSITINCEDPYNGWIQELGE